MPAIIAPVLPVHPTSRLVQGADSTGRSYKKGRPGGRPLLTSNFDSFLEVVLNTEADFPKRCISRTTLRVGCKEGLEDILSRIVNAVIIREE